MVRKRLCEKFRLILKNSNYTHVLVPFLKFCPDSVYKNIICKHLLVTSLVRIGLDCVQT